MKRLVIGTRHNGVHESDRLDWADAKVDEFTKFFMDGMSDDAKGTINIPVAGNQRYFRFLDIVWFEFRSVK